MKSQIPNPKSQINPNYQNSNDRNKGCSEFGIWCLFVIWCLVLGIFPAFAQEENKLVNLSKQIIESKTNEELYAPFEELKDLYVKDHKYADFVEFLKSLSHKNNTLEPFTNYYIALARYSQLKYLEEKQAWDEYFSNGNTYRDEIIKGAQNTLDTTTAKDSLNLYARLLLFKFHRDQQDTFVEDALSNLMNSSLEYSKDATNIIPIKDVADQLLSYGEKAKPRQLYKIYVDKLITSPELKNEDLENIALGFYKEENIELAETVYDVYIERIKSSYPKEKLIPILSEIAKQFLYKDKGLKDPLYAEKVFKEMEELAGIDAFNEELIYLRAFNLEKAKEYTEAKDYYIDLVTRYTTSVHADEADYKVGIIYTYILRDTKTAKNYFEKLAQKETITPQVISGIYQLGLLSQWEANFTKAKEYYNNLLEKAKDDFTETVTLAKERLKEIDEAKPMEYTLKTFLDVSLKDEYTMYDMTKIELRSLPYIAKKDDDVNINSTAYTGESGCMQVELQYLWSGHLGATKPTNEQSSFTTKYIQPGTKEINLVVVSPSGIIDRNIDLVDSR